MGVQRRSHASREHIHARRAHALAAVVLAGLLALGRSAGIRGGTSAVPPMGHSRALRIGRAESDAALVHDARWGLPHAAIRDYPRGTERQGTTCRHLLDLSQRSFVPRVPYARHPAAGWVLVVAALMALFAVAPAAATPASSPPTPPTVRHSKKPPATVETALRRALAGRGCAHGRQRHRRGHDRP